MSEHFLNIAQEIFLVLFSILYGAMLQSLSGLQPFPLARVFRGFVGKCKNKDDFSMLYTREFWNCQSVFLEEKQITIEQFDDCNKKHYRNWLVHMWRRRVFWSFFILIFLPIVYFWGILNILTWIPLSPQFTLFFDFFYILLIFWSALSVFGFYRLYHALFTWRWRSLFCDVAEKIEERGTSFDSLAHFAWACVYILPPLHLLIWIVYF